ncbi:hypothetical protein TNCV_2709331 [Trichonephila clavipes]|nr:hypothetical protein TNCV_2709331 [Trichonephila clavipes]
MSNSHVVIVAAARVFVLSQMANVMPENTKPPSSETFTEDKRFYEGRSDWIKKREQSKPANSEASSGIASAPKLNSYCHTHSLRVNIGCPLIGPHILKLMQSNTRSFWAKFRRGGPSDGAGNPVPKVSPTSIFLKVRSSG